MEVVSNIQRNFFWPECSTPDLSTLILRRTFRSFTRNISVHYLSFSRLSHFLSKRVIWYMRNKLSCRSSFVDWCQKFWRESSNTAASQAQKLFEDWCELPFLEAREDTTERLKPTERRLNNERSASVLRMRSVCKPGEPRQNTIWGKHPWRGVLTALRRLSNICGLIGIPVLKQAGELHRNLSHCCKICN